ncbi:MAG: hypothetical protein EA428_05210, partial [Spirochaetaceae bacterium]
LPATLRYREGPETETALVLGISTLSSEGLKPEIEALAVEDRWLRSRRSDSGAWGFTVSRPIQLTLTWLWENNDPVQDTRDEPCGLHQHQGRL